MLWHATGDALVEAHKHGASLMPSGSTSSPSQAAEVAAAACQLHMLSCRFMHWAAVITATQPGWLEKLPAAGSMGAICESFGHVIDVLGWLLATFTPPDDALAARCVGRLRVWRHDAAAGAWR